MDIFLVFMFVNDVALLALHGPCFVIGQSRGYASRAVVNPGDATLPCLSIYATPPCLAVHVTPPCLAAHATAWLCNLCVLPIPVKMR